MNKSLRIILTVSFNLILVAFAVYVISAAGNKAYTFGHNIFNEESVDSEEDAKELEVVISEGVKSKKLAHILYTKGLAKDETIIYVQILLSDYKDKIKPGTYLLNTGMKPAQILKILADDNGEEEE